MERLLDKLSRQAASASSRRDAVRAVFGTILGSITAACGGGGTSYSGGGGGGCTAQICCGGLYECNGRCYSTCTVGSQPCCTTANCTCYTPCC